MATLTYRKTVVTRSTKTKTLWAWSDWACYTSATNYSLKKKAQTLINKLNKAEKTSQVRSACVSFVAGWERMCKNPRHQRAGVSDTAVREMVSAFMEEAATAVGYGSYADDWWDEGREKDWKLRGN